MRTSCLLRQSVALCYLHVTISMACCTLCLFSRSYHLIVSNESCPRMYDRRCKGIGLSIFIPLCFDGLDNYIYDVTYMTWMINDFCFSLCHKYYVGCNATNNYYGCLWLWRSMREDCLCHAECSEASRRPTGDPSLRLRVTTLDFVMLSATKHLGVHQRGPSLRLRVTTTPRLL